MNATVSFLSGSCGRRCWWRSAGYRHGRGCGLGRFPTPTSARNDKTLSSGGGMRQHQQQRRRTDAPIARPCFRVEPHLASNGTTTCRRTIATSFDGTSRKRQRQRGSSASAIGSDAALLLFPRRQVATTTMTTMPFRYRNLATVSTNDADPSDSSRSYDKRGEDETETVVVPAAAAAASDAGSATRGVREKSDGHGDDDCDFRPPRWLRKMQRRANSDRPMDSQRAYRYLRLEKFDEAECEDRFREILRSGKGRLADDTAAAATSAATAGESLEESDGITSATTVGVMTKDRLRSYLSETIRREERDHDEASRAPSSSSTSSSTPTPSASRTDRLRTAYIDAETEQLWRFLVDRGSGSVEPRVKQRDFVTTLRASAEALDKKRLGPLALSMVMIGLSVGVTTPAFPFVVQNLGLTTGEYGMVVSAFALTKLMGNIPFAVLVERDGRKPYLVYSLIAISAGVGCIGLASGFEELYACRLVTGLGVAGLSCAATMAVTDISTPLNRASSFAPISAGFAAGTAMGPALGGILIDELGVNPTFSLVGGSFLVLGGINSVLLDETMKQKPSGGLPWQEKKPRRRRRSRLSGSTPEPTTLQSSAQQQQQQQQHDVPFEDPENTSIRHAFRSALGQWVPLLSEAPVRNVCIVNAFYWVALAGGQMTLLPLLLTDPNGLAMTATQVGQVYMGMSFVQVLGNPIFAKAVDKVGTVPGIVGGCSMIGTAMYALPVVAATTDGGAMIAPDQKLQAMAAVLGLWAAGSSLLSTSPIAHITQTVDDSKRAQAIALLRTAGDVGFLVGASSMGMVSELAGSLEAAMQSSAAILGTTTAWYVGRNLLTARLEQAKTKTR